jgi:DNA polymerase/3'-5' exonuclease PolX
VQLDGVGKGSASRIDEYLDSGKVSVLGRNRIIPFGFA